MALLIFYLLLALVISFLCSVLEAVLLSVTPSFIQSKMNEDKKWARQLFNFKSDIDRPLAAILSLNTISHTVGAAGVGAQASIVFSNISVGVVSSVLTLLILVFSELIPKTVGANYWKRLAKFSTQTLRILNVVMYPLVQLSRVITFLFKSSEKKSVERSEIVALADIGMQEGVFSNEEGRILKNLINLRSLTVHDIMTPRMVVAAAHEDDTVKQLSLRDEWFARFSRFPIYGENKDDIVGFVHKHDVLGKMVEQKPDTKLKDIAREISVVPEVQSLFNLYNFLTSENTHIARVVEEFGGTAGIVTMEDLLETLLGLEIVDEFDSTEDLRTYARKRWEDRAKRLGISLDDYNYADDNSGE